MNSHSTFNIQTFLYSMQADVLEGNLENMLMALDNCISHLMQNPDDHREDLSILYEFRGEIHFQLQNFIKAKEDILSAIANAQSEPRKNQIQTNLADLALYWNDDISSSAKEAYQILSQIENSHPAPMGKLMSFLQEKKEEQYKKLRPRAVSVDFLNISEVKHGALIKSESPKSETLDAETSVVKAPHSGSDSDKTDSELKDYYPNKTETSDSPKTASELNDEFTGENGERITPPSSPLLPYSSTPPFQLLSEEKNAKFKEMIGDVSKKITEKIIKDRKEEKKDDVNEEEKILSSVTSPTSVASSTTVTSPTTVLSPMSATSSASVPSPTVVKSPITAKPPQTKAWLRSGWATFTTKIVGYDGENPRIRSHQFVPPQELDSKKSSPKSPSDYEFDPCIYWEQKTGIGFCTLNLDHQAIGKAFYGNTKTLYQIYEDMILKSEDKDICNYPFDKWFADYIEALPPENVFKQYYQKDAEKFKIIRLTQAQKDACEVRFHNGLAYVRGDHPNKPFKESIEGISPEILRNAWFKLDTTLLSEIKSQEQRAKYLIGDHPTESKRLNSMIFVKNVTTGKTYTIYDQPGKIYHSIFVDTPFIDQGLHKYDSYIGGTWRVVNAKMLEVKNDSGHIRPSDEAFIREFLNSDVVNHLELLKLYSINSQGEHVEKEIQGNENIKEYLKNFKPIYQEVKLVDEAALDDKYNNADAPKNVREKRDSLQTKHSLSLIESENILNEIEKTLMELQNKKTSQDFQLLQGIFQEAVFTEGMGLIDALGLVISTKRIDMTHLNVKTKKIISKIENLDPGIKIIKNIDRQIELLESKKAENRKALKLLKTIKKNFENEVMKLADEKAKDKPNSVSFILINALESAKKTLSDEEYYHIRHDGKKSLLHFKRSMTTGDILKQIESLPRGKHVILRPRRCRLTTHVSRK